MNAVVLASATRVKGKDLRQGDVVAVWWKPRQDTVTGFRPYVGPHAGFSRIAEFVQVKGMTIEDEGYYEVLNR